MLAIHCLIGCDTTNVLYRIGKRTAVDVLLKNIDELNYFSNLPSLSTEDALQIASKYMVLLYKNKDKNIKKLNKLRFNLTTKTTRPASELPPTDDAFYQHFQRFLFVSILFWSFT